MKFLFFIFLSFAIFSCSKKNAPADILPPDKMEQVLWEQIKADAFTKEFIAKDSSKDPVKENLILQEKIFQQFHITKESFYKSYDWYLAHDEQMKAILDSVIAKQGRNRERERTRKFIKLRNNEQGKKER